MKPWRERDELDRRRIRRQVEQDFIAGGFSPSEAHNLALLSEQFADEMDPPTEGPATASTSRP